MTGLIEKIKEKMKPKICFSQYSLNIIRFKKILEYSRKMMDLFEDGREKAKGEYIFDFHYVASLIEEIADMLDKIVYNASILEPYQSFKLYSTLDGYKEEARKMLLSAKSSEKVNLPHNDLSSGELPEPEYFLLEKVISWFDGSAKNSIPYVKTFMADVFSHILGSDLVFQPGEEEIEMGLSCNGSISIINALLFPEPDIFSNVFEECKKMSLPFQLLTSGGKCREGKSTTDFSNNKKWHVFFDNDYLSMILSDGKEICFKLDSYAGGLRDADFVFIYSKNNINLDKLSTAYDFFTSENKIYGWCFGKNSDEIEKILMKTGNLIFSTDFSTNLFGVDEKNQSKVLAI